MANLKIERKPDRIREIILNHFDELDIIQRYELKALLRSDFRLFAKTVFPQYVNKPFADFHLKIIEFYESDQSGIILAPRGHGKSMLTKLYMAWKLLNSHGEYLVYITSTAQHSDLTWMMLDFEQNTIIRRLYNPKPHDPVLWKRDGLLLRNGNIIRSMSIFSSLRGLEYRGKRPTRVLLDDIQDDKTVESDSKLRKLKQRFRTVVIPLGMRSKITVIGTIIADGDLLDELRRTPPEGWKVLEFPAIINGKPLWPDMWPLELLEQKRREMGDLEFAREFLHQPMPEGDRIFREEFFQYWHTLPPSGSPFVAIDPATGSGTDYTAIVRAIWDGSRLYITHCYNLKISPTEIGAYLNPLLPATILLEANGFQELIKQYLPDTAPTYLIKHTENKEKRISRLLPPIQQGKILFPRSGCEELIRQLLNFPKGRNDDLADALETLWQNVRGQEFVIATF